MKEVSSDILRLKDIIHAIDDIESFNFGKNDDKKTLMAVSYAFAVIGEAGRAISENLKTSNPQVPWPKIISLRNVVIHEYGKVSSKRLKNVVDEELSKFKEQIIDIYEKLLKLTNQ